MQEQSKGKRTARRFPDAGRDQINKDLAAAAQKLADAAGLRSKYLSGESAEFRALYSVTKERGVVKIERRDNGRTAKIKAADLAKWVREGERSKETAAALREVAEAPKLLSRKLAVYVYVATEDKRVREAL